MKSMSEFVQSLRDAADFFESHLALGVPHEDFPTFHYYGTVAGVSVDSIGGLNAFTSIVGGRVDKSADDYFYRLTSDQGSFKIVAVANRSSVCERVVVGTKIEPAHVLPAQPETHVPEREVQIYEYRCPTITKTLPKPAVEFDAAPELANSDVAQLEAEKMSSSNLDTKVLEIRDSATHIPAIAIRMLAKNGVQNYYFRRMGFPPDGSTIGLVMMNDLDGNVDPYAWGTNSTMGRAHHWIYDHFDELSDGDVVDVQFIYGETPIKKVSERLTFAEPGVRA